LRILILKPSSLGDVVHAIPVLRMLRRALPQSDIFWWIDADLQDLLAGDPDLSGTILFQRKRWVAPRFWPEAIRSIRQMRHQRFDWVIDLQALARSGILAWLACGGLTVGLDDNREGASALYDVRVPRPSFHAHAVDWYLETLRALRIPINWDFVWLPAKARAQMEVQSRWQPGGKRWIALQPGARWMNKRWPVEHFGQLVRRLAADLADVHFVILGSDADVPLGEALRAACPARCLDLTGRTTLSQMVEWLRLSDLLITNDSGPMHVATALGKRVVALFGPTEPRRTGPYRGLDQVLQLKLPCVPCLKSVCVNQQPLECLRGLSVTEVYDAVAQAWPSRLIPRMVADVPDRDVACQV